MRMSLTPQTFARLQQATTNSRLALDSWQTASIEERRFFVRATGLPFKWVEMPVDLEAFLYSRKYLNHPKLSSIQLEFVRELSELFEPVENLETVSVRDGQPQDLVAVWGKGCVSGLMECHRADGKGKIAVAQAVQNGLETAVWGTDGSLYHVGWFKRGEGLLVRVETALGKSVDVYMGHKFCVRYDGWRTGWHVGDEIRTVDGWEAILSVELLGEYPYYDTRVPNCHSYILNGIWNHNSGKDTVVMIGMARILYLLGCLYNPQEVFGMPSYSGIDMLNVALNKDQAEQNFFNPMERMLRSSEWFTDKLQLVFRDRSIHCPPIIGKDKDNADMYAINAWSGHSGHEAMEGKNLIVGVVDEIDAFRHLRRGSGNKASSAEAMYSMLSSSVRSRFPKVGKTVMISWPRYSRSFLMNQLRAGKEDPAVFASGPYATWEVRDDIDEEAFARDFRNNLEDAKARYGANPGEAIERYYTNTVAVLRAFHAKIKETPFGDEYVRDEDNPGREPPVNEHGQLLLGKLEKPDRRMYYCWHGDLARVGDRAAVAMAHHSGYILDPLDETTYLPVVMLDLLMWWEATANSEIDLAEIRRSMLDVIRKGYRVGSVTFDKYASEEMLQQFAKHDRWGKRLRYTSEGKPRREPMDTGRFSLDISTKGHDQLKQLVYEKGRLEAFFVPLLVQELMNLENVGGGAKVDHPAGGSKDLADAVAGAIAGALRYEQKWLMHHAFRGDAHGDILLSAGNAPVVAPNEVSIIKTNKAGHPKVIA